MNETSEYERALKKLQSQAGSESVPYGARVNAEQRYAIAYDDMVRLGIKPPLRRKYRVR
jgi:hypothetical protein